MQISYKNMPYDVYEKELLKGLKPSWRKNLLEAYAQINGKSKGFVLRIIDGEAVAYRDMGNGYDIEVSCLCQRRNPFNIYVWSQTPLTMVHKVFKIKGFEQLNMEIDTILEAFETNPNARTWGNDI